MPDYITAHVRSLALGDYDTEIEVVRAKDRQQHIERHRQRQPNQAREERDLCDLIESINSGRRWPARPRGV